MLIYSGTENFVSAMCASIPVLRPLWVKVRGYSSTDNSYAKHSYHMDRFGSHDPENTLGDGGTKREGMATMIFAGGRDKGSKDNASEETILRDARGLSDAGGAQAVLCRTDISVNFSDRDRGNDLKQ